MNHAKGLLKFDLLDTHEHIESDNVFLKLNNLLEQHVKKHQPVNSRIDDVIHNYRIIKWNDFNSGFCRDIL